MLLLELQRGFGSSRHSQGNGGGLRDTLKGRWVAAHGQNIDRKEQFCFKTRPNARALQAREWRITIDRQIDIPAAS